MSQDPARTQRDLLVEPPDGLQPGSFINRHHISEVEAVLSKAGPHAAYDGFDSLRRSAES